MFVLWLYQSFSHDKEDGMTTLRSFKKERSREGRQAHAQNLSRSKDRGYNREYEENKTNREVNAEFRFHYNRQIT